MVGVGMGIGYGMDNLVYIWIDIVAVVSFCGKRKRQ